MSPHSSAIEDMTSQEDDVVMLAMSQDSMDVMIPPDMVTEDGVPEDEADASSCDGVAGEDGSLCAMGEGDEEEEEEEEEDEEEETKTDDIPPNPEELLRNDVENTEEHEAIVIEDSDVRTDVVEKKLVQEKGLDFDMNEPWQRSLLREFQTHYDQPRVRSVSQLVLVGHTESRDFAVEMGTADDVTLTTDSSSTRPMRSQVIHRPWIYNEDSFIYEDEPSATASDKFSYGSPRQGQHKNNAAGARVSPSSLREERDVATSYYVPPSARDAGFQAKNSLQNAPWLEIEPSWADDHDDSTTVAVTANQDACFCMGYNILDLWMPPTTGQKVRRKRRIVGKRRVLGRVAEGSHESSIDRPPQQQNNKFGVRTDPDGAYNDQHYSKVESK